MNEEHTVPQHSTLTVVPIAVTSCDDRQSSPPLTTTTAVHADQLPQPPVHDNHPIPLGLAQENEIPMDTNTFTNQKLPSDCGIAASESGSDSDSGIVQSSLHSTNTNISEPHLIDRPTPKGSTPTLTETTSSKRLNILSSRQSVTPAIPSYIKIGSAHVVPKHHVIQSSKCTSSSIPIEVPVSGKSKFACLSSLFKSDGVKLSDTPQLVFPTPDTHFTNKPILLTPPSHRLVTSASISTVPALIPVKNVGQPKQIPINLESTSVTNQPKKMTSVLIPSSHLKKQAQSSRYINVKISNGQIQSSTQTSFKFVHDGKTLLSSSKMKLMKPQGSFKLNAVKSHSRLLPKYTTVTPITPSTSELSNYSTKKSLLKEVVRPKNDTDMNQDLNRCLQEAVESMFSPNSPTSSSASQRSTGDDEEDVTLLRVLALSATSTRQEERSLIKDPDHVKIELVSQAIAFGTAVEPTEKVVISQDSQTALTDDKQITGRAAEVIDAGESTSISSDKLTILAETLVAVDKPLTEETLITDAKLNIADTTTPAITLTPVDLNLVYNKKSLLRNNLKTQQHTPTIPMEKETTGRPNESAAASYNDGEPSALADKAESLKNCQKDVTTLPESAIQFSVNEYGLMEIDTDSNDKESVKSKFSENSGDDFKSCTVNVKEEKTRIKSKIGILCKRVKNCDKKLRCKDGDSTPEKLPGLKNDDAFAKKKKKKIKSPISKATETTDGTANDGGKCSEDIYHCDACGCYGLEIEFLNSRFCSSLCEEDWTKKIEADIKREKERVQLQLRRRKRRLLEKVHHEMELQKLQEQAEMELQLTLECTPKTEPDSTDPLLSEPSPQSTMSKEETSNDSSQDSNKPRLPWQTGKHGFSWTKYLEYNKAKPAPVKLFKDPFPYSKNNFRVGMKLEGIDPKHPNYFCVLSVSEVCGFRLKLHFDGYSSLYDFWINADSMDIFPAGWCERNGHTLHSPPTYEQPIFNWSEYLKHCRAPPAPKSLFYNKTSDTICPNGFRIGMKLEAVDRQNTSLVCVATVVGLMDTRIMVHFDGWDDIYNYWADPSSSYIHPVGWCEEHGHKLTPPSGWERSEFSWEKYMQETKSTAAPSRAFKQRVLGGFKRGLKLECVDKRMPMAIRVATIDDVREHQIRVKFDGWSDIYSYWVDEDSRDIHPMGWCQTVGHMLELPLTSEDYTLDCPTPRCHGQGHVMGSKHLTNHTVPGCPFDPQILIKKDEIPDRLTSTPEMPTPQVCTKEKRLGETKNPVGRPAKWRRLENNEKVAIDTQGETLETTDFTRENKKKKRKLSRALTPTKKMDINLVSQELRQAVFDPGYKPCGSDDSQQWLKHSFPLNGHISSVRSECDFTNWSEDNVIELITSISNSEAILDTFKQHGIDGEAFSMMTQDDLVSFMGIKIGPALKIFNCIMLLRQKAKRNKVNMF